MTEAITRDNSQLSRPKHRLDGSTIDRTDLPKAVAGYVRDSLADNTRRAHQGDLRHFETWGGSLPASPETVAAYLAAYAVQPQRGDPGPARGLPLEGAPRLAGSAIQFAQSSCGQRCEA
jgi:hypothetical protein